MTPPLGTLPTVTAQKQPVLHGGTNVAKRPCRRRLWRLPPPAHWNTIRVQRDRTPMVRPKDVVAQLDLLYPIPKGDPNGGTGLVPISEDTADELRKILKLASQIPDGLLPKGDERTTYDRAVSEIRGVVHGPDRRSYLNGWQPPTLAGIRDYGGLNALAFWRKVLAGCPNLTGVEIR